MKRIGKYQLKEYIRKNGEIPFDEWKKKLDNQVRARIQARLLRVANGNLGDYDPVGNGVFEFRFHFGAGPRVYFGFDGSEIILLLCGGTKRKQSKDIEYAEALWQEYLGRGEE
jgi:putative addiction module killer protein